MRKKLNKFYTNHPITTKRGEDAIEDMKDFLCEQGIFSDTKEEEELFYILKEIAPKGTQVTWNQADILGFWRKNDKLCYC